ncbi:MAG: hypothetical protein R3C10_13670 [Pirellulales bacterium]
MVRDQVRRFSPDGQRPIAFSGDSRLLAGGGAGGFVYVWDVSSGRELLDLVGHSANVRAVAWNPDGSRLASSAEDGLIKIWDAETGREMMSLRGDGRWVSSVEWSPDGRKLAAENGIWDATAAYEAFGMPRRQLHPPTRRHLGMSAVADTIVAAADTPGERVRPNEPPEQRAGCTSIREPVHN